MRKINIYIFHRFIAILLVLGIVAACKDEKQENEENNIHNTVAVKTAAVSKQTIHSYIELNGNIEARNSVKVYPNISGKIAGSRVNLGSAV
ncbi:MAG: efflux RND transporter periplasmic adaptor subunit, partial [Spirochaetales bacterium]|nr:efflux RND transporter periplasmic adaptor subunit [Spirochaetales bacterium]